MHKHDNQLLSVIAAICLSSVGNVELAVSRAEEIIASVEKRYPDEERGYGFEIPDRNKDKA